jgi:hypothetical protein
MLVVWFGVVAAASWRSRLRRSVRASLSRSWTETTAPVMSWEPCVRSRTLPTADSRLSACDRRRSGTRSSNSPLEPDEICELTT